jgi:hypothetical protein
MATRGKKPKAAAKTFQRLNPVEEANPEKSKVINRREVLPPCFVGRSP